MCCPIDESQILIMGLTFKENCPDIRNTRVIDLISSFEDLSCSVDVYDPWVNKGEALIEHGVKLIEEPTKKKYDAIVLAVAHDEFKLLSVDKLKAFCKDKHVIYDVKYLLKASESDGRL
jgi:UDP-N-acetyl-D-galactosamine dehydrogenase